VKKFSDLGITVDSEVFVGRKIEIDDIFDQEIIIHDFRIVPSKFPKNGCTECLHMQISFENKKRVVFCLSKNLIQHISQVNRADLPILTTIVKQDKKYVFT